MQTSNQTLAVLLHDRECPFEYQCRATDCIECMKIHTEERNTVVENVDE